MKHKRPNGYSLLLGIILLVTMLSISLTITTLLIRQVRLSAQVVDAAQALAAADAGTERSLYIDFKGTPLTNGQVVTSHSPVSSPGLAPFGDPAVASMSYSVTATVTGSTQLTVVGKARGAQRNLQVNY